MGRGRFSMALAALYHAAKRKVGHHRSVGPPREAEMGLFMETLPHPPPPKHGDECPRSSLRFALGPNASSPPPLSFRNGSDAEGRELAGLANDRRPLAASISRQFRLMARAQSWQSEERD